MEKILISGVVVHVAKRAGARVADGWGGDLSEDKLVTGKHQGYLYLFPSLGLDLGRLPKGWVHGFFFLLAGRNLSCLALSCVLRNL